MKVNASRGRMRSGRRKKNSHWSILGSSFDFMNFLFGKWIALRLIIASCLLALAGFFLPRFLESLCAFLRCFHLTLPSCFVCEWMKGREGRGEKFFWSGIYVKCGKISCGVWGRRWKKRGLWKLLGKLYQCWKKKITLCFEDGCCLNRFHLIASRVLSTPHRLELSAAHCVNGWVAASDSQDSFRPQSKIKRLLKPFAFSLKDK